MGPVRSFDHFAFPLAVDKGSGAIAEEGDYERYIKGLILQTLLCGQGERINRSDFGASLRRLIFGPLTDGIESFVQTMVLQALERWLSALVRTEEVRVRLTGEALAIDVEYLVIAQGERHFLTMEVAP